MNILPLQKMVKKKKGHVLNYQSYWVLKPLQSAETITYFHFEYIACYPQGTHNFRTLPSSQPDGKAKSSLYT